MTDSAQGVRLASLSRYRGLVGTLVAKELKTKYAGSHLSLLWVVLEPLLTVLSLSAVFSMLERKASIDGVSVPFPVFFYAGMLPWNLFRRALTHGSTAFVAEASLLTKIVFPKETIVLKNLVVYLTEMAVSALALGVVLVIYGIAPKAGWLWLLPILAIECLLATGVMLLISSVNVFVRDVSTLVNTLAALLFWFSGVAFTFDPHGPIRWLYSANPLLGILTGFRAALVLGQSPAPALLAPALVWAVAMFAVGALTFSRLERQFADAL